MAVRVLLPIMTYPDATPMVSLLRAVDMAATLRAHVTLLVHEMDVPPINNPVADFLLDLKKEAAAAEELSRQKGEHLAQELKLTCHRLAVPLVTETLRTQRPCGDIVAARARTFDMTMLVCQPESPDHALLEQDVLFGSGGPVIVFPASDAPAHIETVAVAWDGSRAAARAIRDAIPILRQASNIRLLTCSEDKLIGTASINGVMELLVAHEINAKHVTVALNGRLVGEALQSTALELDAGMMVMGAYGHSRVREFILGGATTSALTAPRLPLFMSH